MKILENKSVKVLQSENYNFIFNKATGFFARWGRTQEDDPEYSPYGPEIADIEISTICSGVAGVGPCKFCYKSNTPRGTYMSLDTFKKLFAKLPRTVTQIAFGIGDINANPDMWSIFHYCRENSVIPNVTVNGEGITDEVADNLVSLCGAVAVSVYDKEKSYDTVHKLTSRGLKQVNVHQVIHDGNFEFVKSVIRDIKSDWRLEKLNAIVFLSLKPKGRGKNVSLFRPLTQEKFDELITYAESFNVGFGMDSCTAGKFIRTIQDRPNKNEILNMIEPCESTKFSLYVNTEGKFFPCSFMDGEVVEDGGDWTEGIDVVNCNNFLRDVWFNEKTLQFRQKCVECTRNNRGCPHYSI